MNALVRHNATFEGRALTTLQIDGRPAWFAREVGEVIGYAHRGKRFASKITGEWSTELLDGHDYRVVTGRELAAFKESIFKGTGSVPLGGNRGLVVLFESGLHLALVKTRKEAGVRLRRFLADKVLPQLVRTGSYMPEEASPALAVLRERRLQQKADLEARRVAVLETKAHAQALRETVRALHRLGRIDDDTLAAHEVQAAELVTGRDLSHLKPSGPGTWLTPTQIGRRLGLGAYTVGRVISELGLRGDRPGLSRSYMSRITETHQPIVCFAYSPEAVRRIEAAVMAGV